MNLLWVKLRGFRRFSQETKLDCSGRIVALLGPNESGKSSCLEALACLNTDNEIPNSDFSRGSDDLGHHSPVEAHFHLSSLETLRFENEGIPGATRLTISKMHTGRRSIEIKHNRILTTELQNSVRERLAEFLDQAKLSESATIQVNELLELLGGDVEADSERTALSIQALNKTLNAAKLSDSAQDLVNDLAPLIWKLRLAVEFELYSTTVEKLALAILPTFSMFSEEDRLLRSNYNLQDICEKETEPLPKALSNLLSVAQLDLDEFWAHAKDRNDAALETMRGRAHDALDEAVAKHWSQSEVQVRLHFDRPLLKIQIEDSERQFSNLGERSDGLRQFVALMAFCLVERTEKPILLIDEAELHLHYDGQADLMQMLSIQTITSKIIYTTHSIGCLPEDLGYGIRLLEMKGSRTEFRNWFWTKNETGFSPILLGIGASTFAFFPVRNAALAEGESDMLLLPTLIREATKRHAVGYQVVPGLSRSSHDQIRELSGAGKRVVHVVDNDQGGAAITKKLEASGVPPTQIMQIAHPDCTVETIEDYIDEHCILKACNALIERWYPDTTLMTVDEMPKTGRARAIKNWCETNGIGDMSKRAIAYELLSIKTGDEDRLLLDKDLCSEIIKLDENIRSITLS
jgi:predicted ATP-dependent endonuclease of OLD family